VYLKDQGDLDAQGDERDEYCNSNSQTLSCWCHYAIVTNQNGVDVPPTAGHDAALQYGVDEVEKQGGCVENEDRRASLVVLGEKKQHEKEDQARTELDSRNDTMNDSIHDQSIDVPQRKLGLLTVTIDYGE